MIEHHFTIIYRGVVRENPEDPQETLSDVREIIHNSFKPDLEHGVDITGTSLHIDVVEKSEDASAE